jgi:hypothetical protein
MKLSRILFSLSVFISINGFSQTLEEKEIQIAANNHLKSKTQFDYKYINGTADKTGVKSSITTYSQRGEILQVNYLNSKSQIIGWEKYTYDDRGNRTLFERQGSGNNYKKESEYNARNDLALEAGFDGTENFRNEYNYVSGKLSSVVYIVNNKIDRKLVYDNSGNTSNVGVYAGGSELISKIKMVFDPTGNLIEETYYTANGRETGKKTYKYNGASKLTEEAKIQGGKLYYKITQDYDLNGRLIRISEETLAKTKYVKKTYSFDSVGNLTEYKWRRTPDEEFNVKTYTYNSSGVCLTEHTLYPATKFELLSKYEYEYY